MEIPKRLMVSILTQCSDEDKLAKRNGGLMAPLREIIDEMYDCSVSYDWQQNQSRLYELAVVVHATIGRMVAEGKLVELAMEFLEVVDVLSEERRIQDAVWLKLPAGLTAKLFRVLQNPDQKRKFACLVTPAEELRELIIACWKEGNLEDAAILYGSSYTDDSTANNALVGSREGSLSDLPTLLHRELLGLEWDDKKFRGIKHWLRDEIDPP